ncbi:hypothetical protein M758_UG314900 [Ceratodon purpureus]|nr:hypothetical protein M758_UG314900 [Ceratodon purpureus]
MVNRSSSSSSFFREQQTSQYEKILMQDGIGICLHFLLNRRVIFLKQNEMEDGVGICLSFHFNIIVF